ncbi:hypothetical protein GOP47_0007312 [Adiantum capillus-veneris]|uniref:Uncharacterized protein n=1 Tax=Adiantum capillus-veneris TaxID=13818 RepID=A0A9D4V0N2_ADICA|nr:hypothetical protein GOP47_0007312 [Adiantum capillus-veneris]
MISSPHFGVEILEILLLATHRSPAPQLFHIKFSCIALQGTIMSAEDDNDATRAMPQENEGQQGDQDMQPIMTTTSRGFSGAPKFSDFRKTVTSTNTTNPPNKDIKPATKVRGIDDDLWKDRPSPREVDTSAVDEEIEDGHGVLERIHEQFSTVKQEIKVLSHDLVHEVKEFYEKAIKGERD